MSADMNSTPASDAIVLEVRELTTSFFSEHGVTRAVSGVSFSLRRGEAVGLVGESGCGKSVLARSLLRLVPPPGRIVAGEVLLHGEDLLRKSEAEMRRVRARQIAIVLQDPLTTLNPTLPVGWQVAEPLVVHGLASRRAARRRALQLMEMVRLPSPETCYRQFPHELSGGMRQRAIIAAALACGPAVLICDEPTTALDVSVQSEILQLLAEVQQRQQTAMLFISHDLAVVSRVCERVAVMYAGRVVECGPTHEVLTRPLHPYTRGLLQCAPRVHARRSLQTIPGEVPNPVSLPTGCPFHPRCSFAEARCRVEDPPNLRIDEVREVRCVLAEKEA